MARMMQALDTFVGDMPDGSQFHAVKGSPLPDAHPAVRRWPGLFKVMDLGEPDEPAPKSAPAKAEADPPAKAAPAPVKPAPAGRGKAS